MFSFLKRKKPIYGKNVKMLIGGKEIKGFGSWKINTIPWYLRWWYWLEMRRIYKNKMG